MEKVMALIRECRCSINDLSRMGSKNKLPRMNMPFEMGIAYALKQLSRQKENYQIFIFESKVHRIDRTLSDISGQKPKIHENNPKLVIRNIVMWLKLAVNPYPHPEPSQIFTVYERFRSKLPALVKKWYGEPAFDEMVAIAADLAAKQAILPDLYGRLGS
ncbi:MAG: hypothetical protein HZB29_05040 [Nitrospinae bacterium]|nr:hypothetical protein [Nitrospinota bacterium]